MSINHITSGALAVSAFFLAALSIPVQPASAAVSIGFRVGVPIGSSVVHVSHRRGTLVHPRAHWRSHSHHGSRHALPAYYPAVRSGSRWSVGLWVPFLPIGYATYWLAGAPYYYADRAYFVGEAGGYRVVKKPTEHTVSSVLADPGPMPVVAAPPKIVDGPVPTYEQPTRTGQLFAYPRNGQSDTSATFDRIECESSASKLTGFNPALRPAQRPTDDDNRTNERVADYTRAVVACLEGRGYTVK
jgi:hypothetical protein